MLSAVVWLRRDCFVFVPAEWRGRQGAWVEGGAWTNTATTLPTVTHTRVTNLHH